MDNCTACGGSLEIGFIPDIAGGQTLVAVWVAGTPSTNKGLWEILKTGGGVSLEGVEAKAIEAKRCSKCGRIELFANRAPEPGTTLIR